MEVPKPVVKAFPKPRLGSEVDLAHKFTRKAQSAKDRGLDFTISFAEYRRHLSRKTCYYTGIKLTTNQNKPTDRTLDRIDNNKGYVPGNVVACCLAANQLKARWEHPESKILSAKKAEKMMRIVGDLLNG